MFNMFAILLPLCPTPAFIILLLWLLCVHFMVVLMVPALGIPHSITPLPPNFPFPPLMR